MTTPATLRKHLSHHPLLWVGAGASAAAGLPTASQFLDILRHDCDDPIPADLPFEKAVDLFVDSMGQGALGDLLQKHLAAPVTLTDFHRAAAHRAARRDFSAILTTNYDGLLEQALADAKVPIVIQVLEDNATTRGGLPLIKVHGSRDAWSKVVLSGRSYEDFQKRYVFLKKQLDIYLRTHRVLFVGCSLQDPLLRRWIDEQDDQAIALLKPWRALMTESDWHAARAQPQIERLGNILKPFLLAHHGELQSLWRELLDDAVVPTPGSRTAEDDEPDPANWPLPEHIRPLSGNVLRDAKLVDALAAIFNKPDLADILLRAIDYPVAHRPIFQNQPIFFWQAVCRELENGILPGGLAKLFAAAMRMRPHHEELRPALREGAAGD